MSTRRNKNKDTQPLTHRLPILIALGAALLCGAASTLAASPPQANHPFFKGSVGDSNLSVRLQEPWHHEDLLAEEALLAVLGEALSQGVLTGYDLRHKDVYGNFPAGRTFIYSHSSARHLHELTELMALHGVDAHIYVAPKVSAFLYRESWGSANENVKTLASGARVMNGREVAVLFEFDSPERRETFHQLILRYAKKDAADEAGLIADSWWQPFYYTDAPFNDFPSISLVILSSQNFEATLTVLEARTAEVVAALHGKGFGLRVEKVWVNPAFFRFLNGDYR
jgi:hypothetical protein